MKSTPKKWLAATGLLAVGLAAILSWPRPLADDYKFLRGRRPDSVAVGRPMSSFSDFEGYEERTYCLSEEPEKVLADAQIELPGKGFKHGKAAGWITEWDGTLLTITIDPSSRLEAGKVRPTLGWTTVTIDEPLPDGLLTKVRLACSAAQDSFGHSSR